MACSTIHEGSGTKGLELLTSKKLLTASFAVSSSVGLSTFSTNSHSLPLNTNTKQQLFSFVVQYHFTHKGRPLMELKLICMHV